MKATEIKEKLEKAIEAVSKKEATLVRHNNKADKIRKQIVSRGWDLEAGRYQKANTEEHHDCYWTFCDLDSVKEDIKRTESAIVEKKAIVEKWESRLQEAEEKERLVNEKFPEIFKSFQDKVIKTWDAWDAAHKSALWDEYNKMKEEDTSRNKLESYRAFIKKHSYNAYNFMREPAEETHKNNAKAAESLIMNLWNRVRDIVGEATDWSGLHITSGNEWEGAVVNGIVVGTNGNAMVDTIGAGGYNIQKFHYRTLVHKI